MKIPNDHTRIYRRGSALNAGLLCAIMLFGCTTANAPVAALQPGSDPGVHIEVDRPMIVGFFPPYDENAIDSDPALKSALYHFEAALRDAKQCFEPRGVAIRELSAASLTFTDATRRETLTLDALSNENLGCYFAAPGREHEVVRASVGPSSLVVLCRGLASVYFGIPECCPKESFCTTEDIEGEK